MKINWCIVRQVKLHSKPELSLLAEFCLMTYGSGVVPFSRAEKRAFMSAD